MTAVSSAGTSLDPPSFVVGHSEIPSAGRQTTSMDSGPTAMETCRNGEGDVDGQGNHGTPGTPGRARQGVDGISRRCHRGRQAGRRRHEQDQAADRPGRRAVAADEGGEGTMRDGAAGELQWLSAAEAAQAIADKELSPVELMKALLDRVAKLDPRLNAFIRWEAEPAMAAAKAAEAEAVAGRLRGPLHGVPVGIKDIINVAGLPTTCHSKILADNVAKADAVCVQKLRGAGAIVMGKLSTHEFAIGGPSFDL